MSFYVDTSEGLETTHPTGYFGQKSPLIAIPARNSSDNIFHPTYCQSLARKQLTDSLGQPGKSPLCYWFYDEWLNCHLSRSTTEETFPAEIPLTPRFPQLCFSCGAVTSGPDTPLWRNSEIFELIHIGLRQQIHPLPWPLSRLLEK